MTYVLKTVRLHGVSPALDGLKVQVREGLDESAGLLEVTWINGAFLADRALYVSRDCVVDDHSVNVSEDELATDNPYGKFLRNELWADAENSLVWAIYQKALVVNITHNRTGETLYSDVFRGEQADEARATLELMRTEEMSEPIDFMFVAKRINRGA